MTVAIDTTETKKVTISLWQGDQKVDEIIKESTFGSQIILDLIDLLLERQHKTVKDIDGIKVNNKAGSYTGTRVGVAIANSLGYILQIPVNGEMVLEHLVIPEYS